jgi:hypothetical protein
MKHSCYKEILILMNISHRFTCALAALIMVTGTAASAAGPQIEGTPVPTRPRPDFSSMNFLIGTWQCSDLSSRRPAAFMTTEVYSMDPTGYWIVRDTTTHKASWIPREFHSQAKYTYDAVAKRWVRITMGAEGAYSVATAPMPVGNKKTYSSAIQAKSPDIASTEPEVYTKISDTKKIMTTSFSEAGGRVVTVKETCTKS